MAYQSVSLERELFIKSIYTIHYYEYQNDFYFDGERHDFWEFQCVDTGAAEVVTDNGCYTLSRGQVIFHRPNEFHTLKATGRTAPRVVVISFACDSPCMKFFENKVLNFSDTERSILGRIIAEARNCFSSPMDDPYLEQMKKKENIPFGAQQLLILYLEELLIHMIRRCTNSHYSASAGIYDPCQTTSDVCREIIHYLEQHIRESLTIQEISRNNMIGHSQLQKIFREEYQCGVIEFFTRMKICQTAYPGKRYELYSDFRFSWLFFYPLFFPAVQETVRNDAYRICHFHKGNIRASPEQELSIIHKIPSQLRIKNTNNP